MYSENKEKTLNDDISENECQIEDIAENYETDTLENQENGGDEDDPVIDQNQTNLSTEAGPASPDVIKNVNRLYDERKYAGDIIISIILYLFLL